MSELNRVEKTVRQSIASLASALESSAVELGRYPFDLDSTEISDAIVRRLDAYYRAQQRIKILLQKRVAQTGADFFVETILFFLNAVFVSKSCELKAQSEVKIAGANSRLRPDISVWQGDELVAIIECKTQLGWSRHTWETDFLNRENKLQLIYPKAEAFLLVMTGCNWGGFGENSRVGQQYFCLLKEIWPCNYSEVDQVFMPIETLFKRIIGLTS